MLANEAMAVFQEQLAAAGEEGMDDVQARVDALDPADRVELHQVLHLKPKPKRNIPLAEGQGMCQPNTLHDVRRYIFPCSS